MLYTEQWSGSVREALKQQWARSGFQTRSKSPPVSAIQLNEAIESNTKTHTRTKSGFITQIAPGNLHHMCRTEPPIRDNSRLSLHKEQNCNCSEVNSFIRHKNERKSRYDISCKDHENVNELQRLFLPTHNSCLSVLSTCQRQLYVM